MKFSGMMAGLASAAIGGIYIFFTGAIQSSVLDDAVGPAGLPRIYGALLTIAGLLLFAQALLAGSFSRGTANPRDETPVRGREIRRAIGLLAIGVVYVLLLEALGYLLSGLCLLLTGLWYLGAPWGARSVPIAVAIAALLWLVFVVALQVPMPAGLLPLSL